MSDPRDHRSASDLDRTRALHRAFAESRQRVYLERPQTLDQLEGYLPPSADSTSSSNDAPSTLVVTGPSGCGKSALLAHWSQRAASYNPRAAIVAFFVGAIGARLSHLEVIRHLLEELRQRFSITDEIPSDPGQLERALGEWLLRLKNQPLLLMIDALDQLDEESQTLSWLPSTLPSNVRMILSARESRALETLHRRQLPTLEIMPLSYSERLQLSAQYLGARREAIGQEALERVAKQSESGNPLFHRIRVQELQGATNAREAGEIVERFAAASTLEDLYVRVFERIEGLQGEKVVREVLRLLATSRRGLELRDLEALTKRSRKTVDGVLDALSNHLITQGDHLILYHESMRRAIVEKYLSREGDRRRVHRSIGRYLSRELPDRVAIYDDLQARRWTEAAYHLREAASWKSLQRLLSSIPVFDSIYRTPFSTEVLAGWVRLMEEGIDPVETYEESIAEYRRATPSHEGFPRMLGRIGQMFVALGRYEVGGEIFRRAMVAADAAGDRWSLCWAESKLGWVLQRQGKREEAEEHMERALALAREIDDPGLIAIPLSHLGSLNMEYGEYERALELYEEYLRVGEELNDRDMVATAMGNMGIIHANRYEHERALECHGKMLEFARETGDRMRVSIVMGNMAIVYTNLGDYRQAVECLEQKLEIAKEIGDRLGMAVTAGNLGQVHYEQKEFDRAMEYSRQALEISREIGDRQRTALVIGGIGSIHCECGEYEAGLECFRVALEEHRAISFLSGMIIWLHGIGAVLLELAIGADPMPPYLPQYLRGFDTESRLDAEEWRAISLREAQRYAEECIEISARLNNPQILSAGQLLLSRIDEAEETVASRSSQRE